MVFPRGVNRIKLELLLTFLLWMAVLGRKGSGATRLTEIESKCYTILKRFDFGADISCLTRIWNPTVLDFGRSPERAILGMSQVLIAEVEPLSGVGLS